MTLSLAFIKPDQTRSARSVLRFCTALSAKRTLSLQTGGTRFCGVFPRWMSTQLVHLHKHGKYSNGSQVCVARGTWSYGCSGTVTVLGLGRRRLALVHLLTLKDRFISDPETSAVSNYKNSSGNVAGFFSLTVIFVFC